MCYYIMKTFLKHFKTFKTFLKHQNENKFQDCYNLGDGMVGRFQEKSENVSES